MDQIEHFKGEKILEHVEFDRNKDGDMDHMQYYGKGGKLVRVEKSSKFDGSFDWKEFFNSNEKLTHIKIDEDAKDITSTKVTRRIMCPTAVHYLPQTHNTLHWDQTYNFTFDEP